MSLADAFKKAGLKSSEPDRKVSRGEKTRSKKGEKIHDHHHRSECGECRKNAPDVERYEHRNRSVDAQWLCVVCADRFQISDDFRKTAQSDFSRRNMFRRDYGHTCKLQTV